MYVKIYFHYLKLYQNLLSAQEVFKFAKFSICIFVGRLCIYNIGIYDILTQTKNGVEDGLV